MTNLSMGDFAANLFDGVPSETGQQLAAAVFAELYGDRSFEYIERNLGKAGGQVGLLRDLVSLDDAWSVLGSAITAFPVAAQAKLLARLVKLLRDLRAYREAVDDSEIRVLLAVRRGNGDISSIAKASGLSEQETSTAVGRLRERLYRREISLLEETNEGKLTTRF